MSLKLNSFIRSSSVENLDNWIFDVARNIMIKLLIAMELIKLLNLMYGIGRNIQNSIIFKYT